MQIKRLIVKNFKTYRDLDLDLDVKDKKSIILIGGKNGGGKTTLFQAINAALYGLTIRDAKDYESLVNASWLDKRKEQDIMFEITFTGYVLGMLKTYRLRHTYKLIDEKPVENVRLDFDSTTFAYGTHTVKAERDEQQLEVSKIIKANLPRELSEYFLFDALNIGNLVKADQINNLIKDNIRSVMGFNKYQLLKEGANRMIEEERSRRLDDDEQRREFNALLKKRASMEKEVEDISVNLNAAQTYSVEYHDEYQQMLKGERDDTTLREKIKRAQEIIDTTVKGEQGYNDRVKAFVPHLEQNIFIPRIASLIADEAKTILDSKAQLQEQRKGRLSTSQIEELTREVVEIVESVYMSRGVVNVESVIEMMKAKRADDANMKDEFAHLTDDDIKTLRDIVTSRYGNMYPALERERVALNQSVNDIRKLRDNIEDYRAQLTGNNYSLIKKYEENEKLLKQLKLDITAKRRELEHINMKLDQFDVPDDNSNDEKFETLKKLPELFDNISSRLLATRKARIEQQMKDMLNKMVLAYENEISRVELNMEQGGVSLRVFHNMSNEISLDQLNAASKQVVMQVLLKVLRDLGDYDPPVMIDSVMGNFDNATRNAITNYYFPNLSDQTILLSNDLEITADDNGLGKLRPYISKVYTLNRDKARQVTEISNDYFEATL